MKLFKILGGIAMLLVAAIAATFVGARFHDGPIGLFPGGPLTSGEMVDHNIMGWEHFRYTETIELQLAGESTSRTTWFVVHGRTGYIPASLGFPPGKTWHLRADENGEAIIRGLDKRYEVRLDRNSDPEIQLALMELVNKKYGGGPPGDAEVWFFKVESTVPRPEAYR